MQSRRLQLDEAAGVAKASNHALDIDQWTFEELQGAVAAFKELYENPYNREQIDPRFMIQVNEQLQEDFQVCEDEAWEDLDEAEENEHFGRKSHMLPGSGAAADRMN